MGVSIIGDLNWPFVLRQVPLVGRGHCWSASLIGKLRDLFEMYHQTEQIAMRHEHGRENNSTIPGALTATPAVILPTKAAHWLKVHLSDRKIYAALVVFALLLVSRENATVDNISCYSPIHDHFVFWRKPAKANRLPCEQAQSKGHSKRGVCIIVVHPTLPINISPVTWSKLNHHRLCSPIAHISFRVVPSLLPKHELFCIQGLSEGDAQVLEVKLEISTDNIFTLTDLFVVWINKIRGINKNQMNFDH
jgi:hypothetical protein